MWWVLRIIAIAVKIEFLRTKGSAVYEEGMPRRVGKRKDGKCCLKWIKERREGILNKVIHLITCF